MTTVSWGATKVALVINIPKNSQGEELANDYLIHRQAVNLGIPLITSLQLAQRNEYVFHPVRR